MKDFLSRIFLNEKLIAIAIVLNITTIVVEEYGFEPDFIYFVDYLTVLFFIFEMIFKHEKLGFRGYWRSGWNRLDGALVILSLPTLCEIFVPEALFADANIVLIFRTFRVFRFFRLTHFFPNFASLATNFRKAIRDARVVLIAALLIMGIFALICCQLFQEYVPQYFGTPGLSFYSMFRLFTIEGWYEIPDAVSANFSPVGAAFIRIFFSLVIVLGGILCMSLINSIFVDAMVSDNNDDIQRDINRLERKMDAILREKGYDPDSFNDDGQNTSSPDNAH